MKKNPPFTIITINLNNLPGLQKTVESVAGQTWKDFEYLVIDGGSTDGSVAYLESHSEQIDHWITEPDSGIYNAMNKGIRAAKGKYLLFLNSGDELYHPSVLEENKDLIHTDDLVYFDIFLVFPEKSFIHHYPDTLGFITFMEGSIGHPTTFIHRDLFKRIGFYDEKLKVVADWKFFAIAVVKNNCSRRKVNAVLSKFYMDGISSIDAKTVGEERKKVMRSSFPLRSGFYYFRRNLRNYNLVSASRTFLRKQVGFKRESIMLKIKRLIKKIYKKGRESRSLKKLRVFTYVHYLKVTKKRAKVLPHDSRTIPIIIVSFNQLCYLKQLIERLSQCGYKNIVIIDNNSTYEPLIQYLEEIKSQVILHRLNNNYGHMVFWEREELFRLYSKNYYVVTDPDILPDDECPCDFLTYFKEILDSNPEVTKVGFSLRLDDIPESNTLRNKIFRWESQFWKKKDDQGNFLAEIDTTFALYRPGHIDKIRNEFYRGIRTKLPYIARHGGWYIDVKNLTPEQEYFMQTAGNSSSWRINKDGVNAHPSY